LSADNGIQILAATHQYHCPSHLTETSETNFTLISNNEFSVAYIFCQSIRPAEIATILVSVILNGVNYTSVEFCQLYYITAINKSHNKFVNVLLQSQT